MASDVGGLAIALVAQQLLARPASARHSYGFQRAEVLGGLGNGILLLATAGYIFFEAARRLAEPPHVEGRGLLVVATLGLLVNLGSAVLLARARGRSLNMHGAYVHMLADAGGSVGAILAGVAVLAFGATWVDPLVSVPIGILVVWSAWGPHTERPARPPRGHAGGAGPRRGPDEAQRSARRGLGPPRAPVDARLGPACDVRHVVLSEETALHDAQARGDEVKALLAKRFGIDHATLELECHPCDPVDAHRSVL